MLTASALKTTVEKLMDLRGRERDRLARLLAYRRDGAGPEGPFSSTAIAGLPSGLPSEVRALAKASRVNVLRYIVTARVQQMYVDGFQLPTQPENVATWDIWQRNRLDARQTAVHRAALTFGSAFAVVMPGAPVPLVRGCSPRTLSVLYGDDPDWPVAALEFRGGTRWRVYDPTHMYELRGDDGSDLAVSGGGVEHGMTYDGKPVTPVVRFRDVEDVDVAVEGIVEPFIPLQDQINVTTFGLQVAQHYGAFRQRYIIGWLADSEAAALKTGAARLMMFEDSPSDVQVGEFAQSDLRGYIESREASLRHMATVSQTPVHELLGQFVNLSAQALEAARASQTAAVDENRQVLGEAWEQTLNLAGEAAGMTPEPAAAVVWRDTRIRALADAAPALGQLATQLGVPPRALWRRIPGVTPHELETWEALAAEGDSFANLAGMLDRQASGGTDG